MNKKTMMDPDFVNKVFDDHLEGLSKECLEVIAEVARDLSDRLVDEGAHPSDASSAAVKVTAAACLAAMAAFSKAAGLPLDLCEALLGSGYEGGWRGTALLLKKIMDAGRAHGFTPGDDDPETNSPGGRC